MSLKKSTCSSITDEDVMPQVLCDFTHTTDCPECNIASGVSKFLPEILKSMRPDDMMIQLCQRRLVNLTLFDEENLSRNEKAKRILSVIEKKQHSEGAYSLFLECLNEEDSHLGHAYIASLLEGRSFADKNEIDSSVKFRDQINKYLSNTIDSVNLKTLIPYLLSENLITLSEQEEIASLTTKQKQMIRLFQFLETKGPTAHYIFVNCLKQSSDKVPTHTELIELLNSSNEPKSQRKRKVSVSIECSYEVKVTKRELDRYQAGEVLKTKTYFDTMTEIRKLHLKAEWEEADAEVEKALTSNGIDVQIAVLLESCTGLISRRQKCEVLKIVSKAQEMCSQITSDNVHFLKGRCHWVLAKLYRYMNEKQDALEHIRFAKDYQFNIEAGEDTALTNYCHAMILLEFLAEDSSSEKKWLARSYLERSIDHASMGDFGLDLSHPKIRLAQLCLGSSPFQPGRVDDSESIGKARSCLESVKPDTLAPRTKCIFYFTQSDLYRLKKEAFIAVGYAQQALQIANEKGLETEIISAQARLNILK